MKTLSVPLNDVPLSAKSEVRVGAIHVELDSAGLVEERIGFERLLTSLSATFVNVAADRVDAQIEHALEQLVEFLGVDRSSFGQISEDDKAILVTHSFVTPGIPRSRR